MIEINDISKVFRTSEVETVALNHVSLNVEEGEFVAIMGLPVVENLLYSISWDFWIILRRVLINS